MPHVEVPSAEFKVVLLGDTNTGKTSLVLRLVEGTFKPASRSSTIGAFFLTKRLTVSQVCCKLLLWDTAGQEQFQRLAKTYYQNAAAAVICYDISNPRSLSRLKKSLDELNRHRQNNPMVIAIAACKSDLTPVPGLEDEAKRIAKQHDAVYVRTSSKTNEGVEEVFQQTAAKVLEWHEMAVSGQARPLNVTVGTQASPNNTRRQTSAGAKGKDPEAETPSKNSTNDSPQVDSDTENASGDEVVQTSDDEQAQDGSYLCGSNERGSGCAIM